MKRFLGLLKYLAPYKGKVIQNIVFNILGAFFTLFSFAMVMPFLGILFENQELVTEPAEFTLSTKYLLHTLNYYMSKIMLSKGASGALILVSIMVVVFSLLKNSFIYLANHVLAPIRAYVMRDMRNDIYKKLLKLPLSYYNEARKGDVIARIFQ